MIINSVSNISRKAENQDNYWSGILSIDGAEVGVLCVCDGMGGLRDGAKASSEVVSRIRRFILDGGDIYDIGGVIDDANDFIREKNGENRSGTTCTLLWCSGGRYVVYSVGDSRCYRWGMRDSVPFVDRITVDHTVIEKYRSEGKELSEDVIRKYKNVLTRCVGASSVARYDRFEGSYKSGDSFLVCSDGFWHTISETDFLNGNIKDINGIVQRCMLRGEVDNITACSLVV